MAAPRTKSASRHRGEIATLPSGSMRVKVYAGIDPLTGKGHYLTEVIPAGPTARKEAEKARTRLVNQGGRAAQPADQGHGRPADGSVPGATQRRRDDAQKPRGISQPSSIHPDRPGWLLG